MPKMWRKQTKIQNQFAYISTEVNLKQLQLTQVVQRVIHISIFNQLNWCYSIISVNLSFS